MAVIEFVFTTPAPNPRRVGRSLRFELEGLHRARRSDYRVIYAIIGNHSHSDVDRAGGQLEVRSVSPQRCARSDVAVGAAHEGE